MTKRNRKPEQVKFCNTNPRTKCSACASGYAYDTEIAKDVSVRHNGKEHVGHRDLSPGQMAARLGVTVETVEAYLRSLGHRWHCKKEPKFPPDTRGIVREWPKA